jgi:hypothetical protein
VILKNEILRISFSAILAAQQLLRYMDDQFMMLNVPSPDKEFALLKKDEMMPGVSISNSEVGLASFIVAALDDGSVKNQD